MPHPDDILASLDPEQREVARAPRGPMCVLAGAGTGKTRAITHRIAFGVASGQLPARQVLAVTFTARAAGEMRTRLRALGVPGVAARTFHAAALKQLHYFWPKVVGGAAPEVLPHKAGVVAEASGRLGLGLDRTALRDAAAEIEWAKVSMVDVADYARQARRARREVSGLDATAMQRLFEGYEDLKTARHVIDFEDVLLLMVGMMAERPDVAEQVRSVYRHFVVDEFQDVNAVQHELLRQWLGGSHEVCVVGDPSQTIYSFTGASPRHLLDFPAEHPGVSVVKLVRNYRSSPEIVTLANGVIAAAASSTRVAEPLSLRAQGESGPRPSITTYDDDPSEADGVARAVADLVSSGTPLSEIAVLFRTNAQSEAVEAALGSAGIPYLVRGGERFFAREEVRRALVLLRGAQRAEAGHSSLGEAVRDILGTLGWSRSAPQSGGAVRERWESLEALVVLADEQEAQDPAADLPSFLAELERRAADQHVPTVQGVTLASLHSAKGLEWDAVLLIGLSDGLMPITLAEGPEAIEEERRLLYVGLTRARRELRLSWAQSRSRGGRATRRASRFLDPVASQLGMERGEAGPRRARAAAKPPARCRSCGDILATAVERKIGRCSSCPATYDEATFESLRSWRAEVAQEAKVPAYVVFTDATLVAIAETRPSSSAQLATISGVGPMKLERYGRAVLDLLAASELGD